MHSDGVDAMSKLQLRLLICCHRMWGVILHSSVLATDVVIGSLMQSLSVKDFFSVFLCLCPPQHSYQVADAMCDIRDSCFFGAYLINLLTIAWQNLAKQRRRWHDIEQL